MTTKHTTKRALLLSALSLFLCCVMLMGTTFAWFTDSVTSANNIIKSGNLDVEMYWADGAKDVPTTDAGWKDASSIAIFDYDNWEPGYVQVRHVKIENKGSLALKYKVEIVANGEVSDLTDVIDVYYVDPAEKIADRADLANAPKLGTLTEVLAALIDTGKGTLEAGEADTITIAFMMQENAGNEYQDKSIGSDFSVKVLATQMTSESDSFGSDYDATAPYDVKNVDELKAKLASAVAGDEVSVAPGVYELDSALTIPSGVSIVGAQEGKAAEKWAKDSDADITLIKYTGASTESVFRAFQTEEDPADAIRDITIDGIMIDCNGIAQNGILFDKNNGEALEGIKVVNCAVVNSPNNGMKIKNTYGAIVENNYVANVADSGIAFTNYNGYHYETWAPVTAYVRNNVIENVTACVNGAILIENGMGDLVVSGNVIDKVTPASGASRGAAITFYDLYEGGIITVENNIINNAERGIIVYKYSYSTNYNESWWEGPTTDNDALIIKNNVIDDYTAYGIRVEKLHEKSASLGVAYVEITNNTMTSTLATKGLDIVGGSRAGWTVVSSENTFNGAADAANRSWEG